MVFYTPNVIKNNGTYGDFLDFALTAKKMFFSNLYFSMTDNIMQKKKFKTTLLQGYSLTIST
jgi:hypothetical protein